MSNPVQQAMRFFGACAVALAGIAGVGIYLGVEHHEETKQMRLLESRATDSLYTRRLTPIAMDKFAKIPSCDVERPYGATFVAENADGKAVHGIVCSAPNRDNVFKFNP
jgi:hypothetical protein